MEKELITMIVPCYNEEEVLPLFHTEILRVSKEMSEKIPVWSLNFSL